MTAAGQATELLPIKEILIPETQDDLAAAVRAAYETGMPLYPIGGGTSLSLGLTTQVTLRLKPIPQQSALVACSLKDGAAAERLLAALITSKTTPAAIELLTGPAWQNEPAFAALNHAAPSRLFLVVGLEGTS